MSAIACCATTRGLLGECGHLVLVTMGHREPRRYQRGRQRDQADDKTGTWPHDRFSRLWHSAATMVRTSAMTPPSASTPITAPAPGLAGVTGRELVAQQHEGERGETAGDGDARDEGAVHAAHAPISVWAAGTVCAP